MLPLFAGGVMNLIVIAAVTAFVAFEKLAPFWHARRADQRRAPDRGGILDARTLKWDRICELSATGRIGVHS
jgi:predicted metal-binding membrane protein